MSAPPPPPVDVALHTVMCPVCQRKQRLGSRYCDMCGKRLSTTRINEQQQTAASGAALPATSSPAAPPSSTPHSASPPVPLSRRLWDRPLPGLASARSSLSAVRTLQSFLSSLLPIENAYVAAVTKLTCATSTDGMQAATAEAWSFFVQLHIDAVRGKCREVKRIEKALTALTEVLKTSESVLSRLEKEVAEQQRQLRKETEALHRAEAKYLKKHSSWKPPQLRNNTAQSFSRWKLTAEDEEKKGAPPATSAAAGSSLPSSSSSSSSSVVADKHGSKLLAAQQSEHRVRQQHNAVVLSSLQQLERLEQERALVIREVLLQMTAEISHDSMKAFHSAADVRDKLDALDPAQEVRDWARTVESGVPCTWVAASGAGGEVKTYFGSLLSALREDGVKDATGSGESTPGSGSRYRSPDSKTELTLPHLPAAAAGNAPNSSSNSQGVVSSGSPSASHSSISSFAAPVPPSSTPPPPSLPSRSGSILRASPRTLPDSHHQLVVQPSRLLRLEHIATPTLASSSSASEFVPWLPPLPSLAGYHVDRKQWEILAVECLLLSPSFLTHTADGPPVMPPPASDAATALDIVRTKVDLSNAQLEELLAALHFPYRSSSAAGLNPLLPSINYRLLLLRSVDESAFRSLKRFSAFYQRQCHAVLCCLLWHIQAAGGEGGVRDWHHNGKLYGQDKMMSKVLERVKAVLDVYCDGGSADFTQSRRERCDALSVVVEEVAHDLRGDQVRKRDSLLLRIIRGGKKETRREEETAAAAAAAAAEETVLLFPSQVLHNCYRQLVSAAMIRSSDTQLIHSRSPSSSVTVPPSPADSEPSSLQQGEREVEEKMAVLHPHFNSLLSVLSVFASQWQLSPLYCSLCFLCVLLDIVNDQSVVQECPPLNTPALRSSDTLLALLEDFMADLPPAKKAAVDDNAAASEGDDDALLQQYLTRCLRHFESQFTVYLSNYHQSSPALLQRVCQLFSDLLQLLHPPSAVQSAELERVFLREKKTTRILQRSITAEYSRLRAAFEGRVEARHWRQIAEEVEAMAVKEKEQFHRALMPITHISLDVTLPTLSSLFAADINAALAEHPSADPFFLVLAPVLAHLQSRLESLSSSLSQPQLLRDTLLDLRGIVSSHLRHFLSLQVTRIQEWTSTHIEKESWTVVDDSMGCSSSIIDTCRLLFTTVDTFFAAFSALLPHSLQVMPFFLTALGECVEAYGTLLHMSCGDELSGRPSVAAEATAALAASSSSSSMLTRARSLLSDKAPKGPVAALSHHTLASLCVRLCNISVARERLQSLQSHIVSHWEEMKEAADPRCLPDIARMEAELQLPPASPAANGAVTEQQPAASLFSHACDHLHQCSQAMLSLIASRVVFIDWHTPLLTVLYFPLPSSPAVSFRDSGLCDLLDGTMLDLYTATGDANFAGVCEWVWRYLLQAMDWALLGRDRGRGCGLLDVGVIGEQDLAVLEADLRDMKELFVDDLGADKMQQLSVPYEALLQKLRYRLQSNLMTPRGAAGGSSSSSK